MSFPLSPDSSRAFDFEAFADDCVARGLYPDRETVIAAAMAGIRRGQQARDANWLTGGGECGALIRAYDWASTPLGPLEFWPDTVRVTVTNIVNSPVAKVLMWGPDHVMIYNDAYRSIAGEKHPGALGGRIRDVWPEVWSFNEGVLAAGLRGETTAFHDRPMMTLRHGVAEEVTLDLFYTPVRRWAGDVGGVMCTIVETTERTRFEQALSASNKRFVAAVNAVHGVLWVTDARGELAEEQGGWTAMTGQGPEAFRGMGWAEAVHPEDRAQTAAAWKVAIATGTPYVVEHRLRRADGRYGVFSVKAVPIRDVFGRVVEWVGIHTDISHQRAAEASLREQAEALARQVVHRERAEAQLRRFNEDLEARVIAEIAERRQAEEKLARAQKLETIGKLTGGVAHDFNNLLQVILGNLQLLAKDVAGNGRGEGRVASATASVMRGAKLASQLLAFGRRQALEPKVVNVSRFVQGMDEILRRAIGEAIEIETIYGGGLWNTFIDPAQVENALLNLAINARDAMEGVGKLTIELSNAHLDDLYARTHDEVTPGQYVMLAVSDTGAGMSADVIGKVFEPFFTTKAEGKGSGLGLSMVYGFVKQSGGHVKIYSEVGHGTTIRLYLPRAVEAEDVPVVVETGPIEVGTETVLVVEDDGEVRDTVVSMLSDLGYRVLKAVDAASALSVIESGIPIDVLFTDVVMPGTLKSPELARKARERLPEIAVLFTSGYTENSIVHGGRLDAGVELLSKPYTQEALARKIRHVIGNRAQVRVSAELRSDASSGGPVLPEGHERGCVTVLLVEDDALIRLSTADILQDGGYSVVEAGTAEEARAALEAASVDVLMTDVNLPGASGIELARWARGRCSEMGVIFATGDVTAVREAGLLRAVALAKPYSAGDLLGVVAGFAVRLPA